MDEYTLRELVKMSVYFRNQRFSEVAYTKEIELERDVVLNAEMFFGQRSIYIDTKKKIEGKSLGGSIPDGFLFKDKKV